MNIAIYGGAFDPFTKAHLSIIDRVGMTLDIDKIFIEPAHKSYKNIRISWTHRVNMIKLSLLELSPGVFMKTRIGFHDGCGDRQPYAYETLRYYNNIKSVDNIYYIIGTDELKVLDQWKEPEEILKYDWIVFERGDDNASNIIDARLWKYKRNFIIYPFSSYVSSTELRNAITKNCKFITGNTLNYVKQNKLYRAGKDVNFDR